MALNIKTIMALDHPPLTSIGPSIGMSATPDQQDSQKREYLKDPKDGLYYTSLWTLDSDPKRKREEKENSSKKEEKKINIKKLDILE